MPPQRTGSAAFGETFFAPRSLAELLRLRAEHPEALLMAGATQRVYMHAVPKTARAEIGFSGGGGPGGGGEEQGIRVFLNGDSTQTLAELADNLIPMLASRPEFRDVEVERLPFMLRLPFRHGLPPAPCRQIHDSRTG